LTGAQKENVKRVAAELVDDDKDLLHKIAADPNPEKHDKKVVDGLKKRQLLNLLSKKSYKVTKGPNYMPQRAKLET
jgi:hypothetical protein